jgi:hypothetical protein
VTDRHSKDSKSGCVLRQDRSTNPRTISPSSTMRPISFGHRLLDVPGEWYSTVEPLGRPRAGGCNSQFPYAKYRGRVIEVRFW